MIALRTCCSVCGSMYYETCSVCPPVPRPMKLFLVVWNAGYLGQVRVVRAASADEAKALARMPAEGRGMTITCEEVSAEGEPGVLTELEWEG